MASRCWPTEIELTSAYQAEMRFTDARRSAGVHAVHWIPCIGMPYRRIPMRLGEVTQNAIALNFTDEVDLHTDLWQSELGN